jgi:proline dehydrogenase
VHRAARRYVVGPTFADALRCGDRLRDFGRDLTIAYWNAPEAAPQMVRDECLALVRALGQRGLRADISIKAPALGASAELTSEILETASAVGIGVRFDSLAPEAADRMLALASKLASHDRRPACTLPARWRRSIADAEQAVALHLPIRLVKGHWPESRDGGRDRGESRFVELVQAVAGRAAHVALATHDVRLARSAARRLVAAGTPCELELLLALSAHPLLGLASELGLPVRVYVPYGEPSLPYRPADALRRPRLLAALLRDAAAGAPRRRGDPRRWRRAAHS